VASEVFVSAMMLITGVVAAAILIVAVLPIVWSMVGTFSSASAATDRSMRTDFKIVTTYADYSTGTVNGAVVTVWMKNIGTTKIGSTELSSGADVYVGKTDIFSRATRTSSYIPRSSTSQWNYTLYDLPTGSTGSWDPGETLQVDTFSTSITAVGQSVYFQFSLPSGGVTRSAEFTAV
jgi:flagellar protein FlaG